MKAERHGGAMKCGGRMRRRGGESRARTGRLKRPGRKDSEAGSSARIYPFCPARVYTRGRWGDGFRSGGERKLGASFFTAEARRTQRKQRRRKRSTRSARRTPRRAARASGKSRSLTPVRKHRDRVRDDSACAAEPELKPGKGLQVLVGLKPRKGSCFCFSARLKSRPDTRTILCNADSS